MIVPATNRPSTLPGCLEAIHAAKRPSDEVIVIEEPADAGPALARNRGAERARGDVLVFVDADVNIHPDALRRIRTALEADPGLTAVFGSYDATPPDEGVISAFRNLLHHHVHQRSPGPASTFWAGLGGIRREAFLAVGGFDAQRYRLPSIEDIDLGMRLASADARIELDPQIQGTHLKAWSLAEMVRTDFDRRGVPWVALLLRQGSAPTALNLGWRHRLSALTTVVAMSGAITRRPRLAAGAVLALVALNGSFYALLARRRGPHEAAVGIGLHALHHLTAVAAVPIGILAHLRESREARVEGRRG